MSPGICFLIYKERLFSLPYIPYLLNLPYFPNLPMHSLFTSYLFLIPLIVGLATELLKVITEGIERGAWHEGLFRPGGMPSSHSAFVTSLLIVIAKKSGLESSEFAVAFVFSCLVWYDAMSSRHAIGEQAKILNILQKKAHLSERLGHSLKEVVGGILFGAAVTITGMWVV